LFDWILYDNSILELFQQIEKRGYYDIFIKKTERTRVLQMIAEESNSKRECFLQLVSTVSIEPNASEQTSVLLLFYAISHCDQSNTFWSHIRTIVETIVFETFTRNELEIALNGFTDQMKQVVILYYRTLFRAKKRKKKEMKKNRNRLFLEIFPNAKWRRKYDWFFVNEDFETMLKLCTVEKMERVQKFLSSLEWLETLLEAQRESAEETNVETNQVFVMLHDLLCTTLHFACFLRDKYQQKEHVFLQRIGYLYERYRASAVQMKDLFFCESILKLFMTWWTKFKPLEQLITFHT
jgi:hypothetical protein